MNSSFLHRTSQVARDAVLLYLRPVIQLFVLRKATQMEPPTTLKQAIDAVRAALPPGASASASFAVNVVGDEIFIGDREVCDIHTGNHISVHVSNCDAQPGRSAVGSA